MQVPKKESHLLVIYIVTAIALLLTMFSFLLFSLQLIWYGESDIFSPLRIGFLTFVPIITFHLVYDLYLAVRASPRRWNTVFTALFGLGVLYATLILTGNLVSDFLTSLHPSVRLPDLPYEIKIYSTFGLLVPLIFVAISFYYFFSLSRKRNKLLAYALDLYKKQVKTNADKSEG